MSFDISRFTFDPRKDYSGVVMQQGRVQLDSGLERMAGGDSRAASRPARSTSWAAPSIRPPRPTPSRSRASTSGGRQHPDHRPRPHVCRWTAGGKPRRSVDGDVGPRAGRNVERAAAAADAANTGRDRLHARSRTCLPDTALPARQWAVSAPISMCGSGQSIYLEDPDLIDKAVGIDTTGRLQTVWQVKLISIWPTVRARPAARQSPAGRRRHRRACSPRARRRHLRQVPAVSPPARLHRHGEPVLSGRDPSAGNRRGQRRTAGEPRRRDRDLQVVARQRLGHHRRHQHWQRHEQRGQSGEPAHGAEPRPRPGAGLRAGQLDRDSRRRRWSSPVCRRVAPDRHHRLLRAGPSRSRPSSARFPNG